MEKRIGKIESIYFGIGGYQDAMIGLHVVLSGKNWGVGDSKATWDAEMVKHSEYSKWTEKDRDNNYAEIMRYLSKLFKDANVNSVEKLKNIPIEASFDGSLLKEWRILTEVL